MISKKLIYGLVLVVAIGLAIGTYSVRTNHNKSKGQTSKKVEASSSQAVLTSQSDWEAGIYDGSADLTSSPGDVKMSAASKIDLSGKTVTATQDEGEKNNVIDGNLATLWQGTNTSAFYWIIDLGSSVSVSKVRAYNVDDTVPLGFNLYTSTNGVDYTLRGLFPNYEFWREISFLDSVRYLKLQALQLSPPAPPATISISELEIYGVNLSATHTSAATQLNGGTDFFEWQTFTPTYTKPANTNVQFRFRSSTNSTDWSGWTDYQTPSSGSPLDITSLVTSRTGPTDSPTFYKYLQVETKLTSTDGTSTPTLSEYSIGYHTNRPPNKPVAGTVIIGN